MKKLLILILIALVLVLTIYTIIYGLQIGNFSIWGIQTLQTENSSLDKTIMQATELAKSTFPGKVKEVNESMKQLEEQKTIYKDMAVISSSEDVESASQLSNYTLDFLWTEIGAYATSEGVNIDISLTTGTGGEKVYDLHFTVVGSYIGISEFIRDIEDDSNLAFKIEEFSITAGESTSILRATFICKNIPIEGISSLDTKMDESTNENAANENATNENKTNENATNTTNTKDTNSTNNINNTTNTVNNTNTTNTSNQ